LDKSTSQYFRDTETDITPNEVVRNQDIFFIRSCNSLVNDHIIETLLFLDAFLQATAHSVSVVMPYFPYSRQDRMSKGRKAISARVVANLLVVCEWLFYSLPGKIDGVIFDFAQTLAYFSSKLFPVLLLYSPD
jgi:phosphoribosylpyrophosphate synthetase